VNDTGADSAQQIEYQEAEMAQPILDVVAENPQVPHVAEQMEPAAMEKHRSQKGDRYGGERQIGLRPGNDSGGHHAILRHEPFERCPERQFVDKAHDVDGDYQDGHDWE
jgi:hypothetical protein